ncbi:DUF4851 domain-containing protein [Desulfovibrio sp. OttesenSCG-928-O18]|nr:DUF4851 domain-containing protein [Desulfovibrio sp. OttesenSCG-928-O18]
MIQEKLKRYGARAALWFALVLLVGCTAARIGVSGNNLVRTAYPRTSIAAKTPLILQGYGRQWVSLPTEYMGMQPTGGMDYAVYGEGSEGPITRHAHAFIVRPGNDYNWYFQPESYPAPGGVHIGRKDIDGYRWVTQILRVDGEKDWFSAMWKESGRDVPEFWIARRFSATPERATRVVAEYREPWPECLDPGVKDLVFVRASCLEGFLERADAAFTLNMGAPENAEEPPAAPSVLRRPPFPPDMKRLAGELQQEDFSFRRWR